MPGVEVQRLYLKAAQRYCERDNADARWTLEAWEEVLDDLETDPLKCRDRVDWVAKRCLIDELREAEHLDRADPWLQSVDLEYHNVSLEKGLHHALVRAGSMRRFLSEEAIKNAIFQPPETTRAFFRGRAVARFSREISSIQWDEVTFQCGDILSGVTLSRPAHDAELERVNGAMREATSVTHLLRLVGQEA